MFGCFEIYNRKSLIRRFYDKFLRQTKIFNHQTNLNLHLQIAVALKREHILQRRHSLLGLFVQLCDRCGTQHGLSPVLLGERIDFVRKAIPDGISFKRQMDRRGSHSFLPVMHHRDPSEFSDPAAENPQRHFDES